MHHLFITQARLFPSPTTLSPGSVLTAKRQCTVINYSTTALAEVSGEKNAQSGGVKEGSCNIFMGVCILRANNIYRGLEISLWL